MNIIVRITLLGFVLLSAFVAYGQSTFDTCSAEGNAQRANAKALNLKKNRDGSPTDAQINRKITFEVLMTSGEHPTMFKEGDGAEIIGYVSEVKIGAIETCNCKAKDTAHRDTHIELTIDPMDEGNKSKLLVVEVTPRFQKIMHDKGLNWTSRGLRDAFLGRWVKVRGWVFYDAMHDDESASSEGTRVWRGSPWEIHPVTHIEITTRPYAEQPSPVSSPSEPTVSHESTQCTGKTQKGKRCSRMTTDASGKCYQHK